MHRTLGYHWVKSCFGLWLPGDDRGSWWEAWDEQIGFVEPHMLQLGDPVRLRITEACLVPLERRLGHAAPVVCGA